MAHSTTVKYSTVQYSAVQSIQVQNYLTLSHISQLSPSERNVIYSHDITYHHIMAYYAILSLEDRKQDTSAVDRILIEHTLPSSVVSFPYSVLISKIVSLEE